MESSRGLRRPSAASAAAIAALALAFGWQAGSMGAVARAASTIPTVVTGGAQQVSYGSATLTGTVTPRGNDASYYFQYGPTKLYGGQTAIADAGAGTHTVHVSVAVTGLQPLTVYHYRLIAVNGGGAGTGKDATLLTTKVPLSLQVLASPDPVAYGGTVIIQGALSGTGNAGMTIVLQANPFPFTAGFQ